MAVRLALFTALILLALPSAALAEGDIELIVKRDPGLTKAERSALRADAGVHFKESLTVKNYELVIVPAGQARAALADLNANPDVQFAEKNGRFYATTAPPFRINANDPGLDQQYSLYNSGQAINGVAGTAGADTNARFAWNLSLGGGVKVAVIDTGVQMDHPDLVGQAATNSGEIAGNGIDDDGNGYVDDRNGWDFVSKDNNPSAVDNGHGTHVTGIIAASRNNNSGISGLAPSAQYVPLRALGSTGSGSWSDIIEAFDYAGKMGYPIANASLGGTGTSSSIDDMIASHPNTLYVFAAGNDNNNLDSNDFYPCEAGIGGGNAAANNNTICVASTDKNDAKSSFSNYSSSGAAVDIAAPGSTVYSTYPTNSYAYLSGTSMASPNVAAAAALVVSADPSKKGQALKTILMNSAQAKPALNSVVGSGRLDALAAVKNVRPDGDNDGVADSSDLCPALYSTDAIGCPDSDNDGVADNLDNCPNDANANQADDDSDGQGNACDLTPRGGDDDGDGVAALDDNCPDDINANQTDDDNDGQGNVCDATPRGHDDDSDGLVALDDNCPNDANANQADDDSDGQGNVCDLTPRGQDDDGDGVGALDDNCPNNKNANQADDDNDGQGNVCDLTPRGSDADLDGVGVLDDNCPSNSNPSQADDDSDGQGNACDLTPRGSDDDGDGVAALDDNCPAVANADQTDADSDGQGNACDATPRGQDNDGDGRAALDDNCPNTSNASQADDDSDGQGNACDLTSRGADIDSDGVGALDDNCPNNKNTNQSDRDRDGLGDACDSTPDGLVPPPNPDSDGDGFPDSGDKCPNQAGPITGCPQGRIIALKQSRSGKRYNASVTIDQSASVTLTLEKAKCKKCTFSRSGAARKTIASANTATKVALGSLRKGYYRLTVTIDGTSSTKTVSFQVK